MCAGCSGVPSPRSSATAIAAGQGTAGRHEFGGAAPPPALLPAFKYQAHACKQQATISSSVPVTCRHQLIHQALGDAAQRDERLGVGGAPKLLGHQELQGGRGGGGGGGGAGVDAGVRRRRWQKGAAGRPRGTAGAVGAGAAQQGSWQGGAGRGGAWRPRACMPLRKLERRKAEYRSSCCSVRISLTRLQAYMQRRRGGSGAGGDVMQGHHAQG